MSRPHRNLNHSRELVSIKVHSNLHGVLRIVLSAQIQIFTFYTDEDYVLGWSCFGEDSFVNHPLLGDYPRCAGIRIKGGAQHTKTISRIFLPDNMALNASTSGRDSCLAFFDDVGTCKRTSCLAITPTFMAPDPFQLFQYIIRLCFLGKETFWFCFLAETLTPEALIPTSLSQRTPPKSGPTRSS